MCKKDIVKAFGKNEHDTGSTSVQIALLTDRIKKLNGHLMNNKKDYSTNRGLMVLVGQRQRLLNYLKRNNLSGYQEVIQRLGLRK